MAAATTEAPKQAPKQVTVPREVTSGKRLLDRKGVQNFLATSTKTIAELLDDPKSGFPKPFRLGTAKEYWTVESIEKFVTRLEAEASRESR